MDHPVISLPPTHWEDQILPALLCPLVGGPLLPQQKFSPSMVANRCSTASTEHLNTSCPKGEIQTVEAKTERKGFFKPSTKAKTELVESWLWQRPVQTASGNSQGGLEIPVPPRARLILDVLLWLSIRGSAVLFYKADIQLLKGWKPKFSAEYCALLRVLC